MFQPQPSATFQLRTFPDGENFQRDVMAPALCRAAELKLALGLSFHPHLARSQKMGHVGCPFPSLKGRKKKNCFGFQPCCGALKVSRTILGFRGPRHLHLLIEGDMLTCSARQKEDARSQTEPCAKAVNFYLSLSSYSLLEYL